MSMRVRIGMLRLTDSAPVVIAKSRGLFAEFGLHPILSIEPSWANIADKLAYGLLDAAVMLPPLVLASAMGLRGPAVKLVVPMGMSQGGNTIVFGGGGIQETAGMPPGARLLAWMSGRRPRIAVVHRFSTHNLLLRYWLSMAGVDPDRGIETVVVPPDQVVAALASRQIDGFCAGAPWGAEAVRTGAGSVLLGTSDIWPFHPEKCLAVREDWAFSHKRELTNLLRSLMRAQVICDRPEEGGDVVSVLSDPDGLGLPGTVAGAALAGGAGHEQIHFHAAGAAFPAPPHALWFLRQMRRWGWLEEPADLGAVAASVYRPDLFAQAARSEDFFTRTRSWHNFAGSEASSAPFASESGTSTLEF